MSGSAVTPATAARRIAVNGDAGSVSMAGAPHTVWFMNAYCGAMVWNQAAPCSGMSTSGGAKSGSSQASNDALVRTGTALVEAGMRGVVHCGSMGEWPLLSDEQRQEGVRRLVEAGVPVVVGTGAQSPRAAVAHAAPELPAVIYNSPYYGYETVPELFFELRREHANLVGFKEFGGAAALTRAAEHITHADDAYARPVDPSDALATSPQPRQPAPRAASSRAWIRNDVGVTASPPREVQRCSRGMRSATALAASTTSSNGMSGSKPASAMLAQARALLAAMNVLAEAGRLDAVGDGVADQAEHALQRHGGRVIEPRRAGVGTWRRTPSCRT